MGNEGSLPPSQKLATGSNPVPDTPVRTFQIDLFSFFLVVIFYGNLSFYLSPIAASLIWNP